MLRRVGKEADKIKNESISHRLWSKIMVFVNVLCYNGSRRGGEYGEFVNESRKDVYGLAQIRVIPSAEKGSSRVDSLVKACTDRIVSPIRGEQKNSLYSSIEHSLDTVCWLSPRFD